MNELEIIQHPQIEGLSLFFDTVNYRTPHMHREWELIWVWKGRLSVRCGSSPVRAGPGELVLFGPRQAHEFHVEGEPCTFLCLQFAPTGLPAVERIQPERLCPREFLTAAEYRGVQETLLSVTEAYLTRPGCYELLCLGQSALLLRLLLSRLPCRTLTAEEMADQDRRNARLARLMAFVDENYMHKIRLSDFAAREDRSMSYLSHFVKEALNQSFQEYVNTVRFNCACRLIAMGNRRMLDVCMESGFSDYRYFSKTFRQRLNMTPEEYSRQLRPPVVDPSQVHHSLHSLERFYTRQESLELLAALRAEMEHG